MSSEVTSGDWEYVLITDRGEIAVTTEEELTDDQIITIAEKEKGDGCQVTKVYTQNPSGVLTKGPFGE